ncbi:MAG: hypothetical protein LBJ00_05435 [Planctomycetaceae bacterium]|nr:hypothetical protein [Planctomycetaceae bacterium]
MFTVPAEYVVGLSTDILYFGFHHYTVAGKAIGFTLKQPLHVVTLACPASEILK